MPRETLIGSYLLRLTREVPTHGGRTREGLIRDVGRTRIILRDLRSTDVLEFETWVAAWAYVDRLLHDLDDESALPSPTP
jgi:hypothetical protein